MAVVDSLGELRDATYEKLDRYGMGVLFSANVLGAGSVYILASTGANIGFALLWVFGLTFVADMLMHDMSSRLAARGRPLMVYIRSVLPNKVAVGFAISMALVMQLWAVANYAVAGAALAYFLPVDVIGGIAISASVAVFLLATSNYDRIEGAIATLLLVVFGAYAAMLSGLHIPVGEVTRGLVPALQADKFTLYIAILGTTIYYPNFYIQSSMQPTKEWTALKKYRRDNAVGISAAIIISVGMLGVAAITLSPGELTLLDPAIPVAETVGAWAIPVFAFAVLCASFTSATGTLFGSGFAVPQSFGRETVFGDRAFTATMIALISLSSILAILALVYTNLTPVRMAIVMPALNGAIFLPITIFALYGATRDEMTSKQKFGTMAVGIVLLAGSILTAQSLYETILSFI